MAWRLLPEISRHVPTVEVAQELPASKWRIIPELTNELLGEQVIVIVKLFVVAVALFESVTRTVIA